uniref:THAP domain-containing protein 7-like n=1 Tax=Centroberyx gerrardi TaxID=166262 RepID=UPI003AAF9D29
MPKSCCVPCCTNNTRKNNGVKFFCVPKDGKRRMKWFQSIRREDGPGKLWAPASKHIYVCSSHFVTDAEEIQAKMNEYSTFQRPYDVEKVEFLLETAKTNIKNNKETILREIHKAAERRQGKRKSAASEQ